MWCGKAVNHQLSTYKRSSFASSCISCFYNRRELIGGASKICWTKHPLYRRERSWFQTNRDDKHQSLILLPKGEFNRGRWFQPFLEQPPSQKKWDRKYWAFNIPITIITSKRFQKYRIRCCIKAAVAERAKYEKPGNFKKFIISK